MKSALVVLVCILFVSCLDEALAETTAFPICAKTALTCRTEHITPQFCTDGRGYVGSVVRDQAIALGCTSISRLRQSGVTYETFFCNKTFICPCPGGKLVCQVPAPCNVTAFYP
eukprot:TRINITY_DN1820_c0_g1_i1.p1 TRINITY_DN1820_c0_g1~~TRINITY_DN1820_c0_g1_i1.p1  ORF type:complete len:114 (-),score=0.32 TRINITY_DN1820_c0_g1_i1:49-390(-)